jgi:hypothetical protein
MDDERLTHIVHGVDLGPARNFTLVAEGRAPYLALLHDDDLWEPGFLERRVAFLEAHPSCGFVFSGCVIIDGQSVARDVWDVDLGPGIHTPESFLPAIYLHNVVPVPTAVVRRSSYAAAGGKFHDILFNDHELWLRLGSEFDAGVLKGFDASYRVHEAQTTFAHLRRLGEHRIEFQAAIQEMLGERIPRGLRRRAEASAHLHVAADAIEGGRAGTAVKEVGRAAIASPSLLRELPELRRAGLLLAAAALGRPGRALWQQRRDSGRRRASARAALRVVPLRARAGHDVAPAFSVVVPARDAAGSITRTIESVLMQSEQDFEIVVVDDGSNDETTAVAREAGGDRVRVERTAGIGVSAARNLGVRVSRGRWVSFLDADDLWLPSYLAEMRDALDRSPGPALAFTDAWVLDEAAGAIRRQPMMARRRPTDDLPEDPHALFNLLLHGNFVFTSATVARAILEEVGGYDESLSRAEDYDLWLRILEAGHAAVFRPGPLAVYRLRPHSLSTDRLAMALGECRVLESLLARGGLSTASAPMVAARIDELKDRIRHLESGAQRRSTLPVRALMRVDRLRREGTLFRSAPPEIEGGFPDLVYGTRLPARSNRTADAPGADSLSRRGPRLAKASRKSP